MAEALDRYSASNDNDTKKAMAAIIAAAETVSVTSCSQLIAAIKCTDPEKISYVGPNTNKDIRNARKTLRSHGVAKIKNLEAAEREDRFDQIL